MFGFNKPKCDLDALIQQIKTRMQATLEESLQVTDTQLECITHKQGVDVIFSFIKPGLSPVRKKISHQIRQKHLDVKTLDELYGEVFEGLHRLAEIRINEMSPI
ncbi:MAG: hypothetical protein H7A00_00380 [Hahellaceae bacterium]|nr:hypothetical protein [Hahellaceae bacterium]